MAVDRCRLDRWLYFARLVKSRTLAQALIASGRLRRNGEIVAKSHATINPGDVLTFPLGARILVLKVLALGERRGPFPEARALYEDLSPPDTSSTAPSAPFRRDPGSGRPTKRDRRALAALKTKD